MASLRTQQTKQSNRPSVRVLYCQKHGTKTTFIKVPANGPLVPERTICKLCMEGR